MENVLKSFRLDGKTALVTGASHGIGFAMAKALYDAGAKIIFNRLYFIVKLIGGNPEVTHCRQNQIGGNVPQNGISCRK